MKLQIRQKIILFIIVPVAAVYALMLYFGLNYLREQAYEQINTRTTEKIGQQAELFDSYLRESAVAAESTATALEVNPNLDPDELYAILRRNVTKNRFVYGSAIAFMPGQYRGKRLYSPYVCGTPGKLKEIDIAVSAYDYTAPQWDWWHDPIKAGHGIWTEPYFDKDAGNVLMTTYSVPFKRDGEIWGVATVDIPLDPLQERFNLPNDPLQKYFVLMNSGQYLYQEGRHGSTNDSIFAEAKRWRRDDLARLGTDMISGKGGIRMLPKMRGGEDYWVSFAPIASTGWSLGVWSPESVMLAPVHNQLSLALLGLSISLVIISAIVWIVANRVTTPIAQFDAAAQQIAAGNLDTSISISSNDEIGNLARSFTMMATKVRERESSLRDTRGERLAQLLEGLGDKYFFYSLKPDGTLNHVSQSVETTLGYTSEEYRRDYNHILTRNPINKDIQAHTEKALQGGPPPTYEVEMRHRNGSLRRLEICERPLFDESKQVISVEGLVCDVTERVSTTEWFRGLLEAAPDGMVILDADGNIVFVNTQTESLFGYSRESLIGNPHEILIPRQYRDEGKPGRSYFGSVLSSPIINGLSLIGLRSDGREFPAEVSLRPLHLETARGQLVATTIRDITERRRAEQALRESEARLSKTTENAPGLIYQFVLRPDGTAYMPYASAWCLSTFGVDPADLTRSADPLTALIHPDDMADFQKSVELSHSTMQPWNWEGRFVGRNGDPLYMQGNARPERMDDESTLWNGVLTDISEIKRAEEALRSSEQQFRSLVDNIPGAVYKYALDSEWTMDFISEVIQSISGYPASDFINNSARSYLSIVHPEDVEQMQTGMAASIAARQPYACEYRIIHADGSTRWVYEKGQAVPDPNGHPEYLIGSIFDVTDRREMESALRESDKQFRSIFENMQDGYILASMEGVILLTNPATARILGYNSPEELVGKKMARDIYMNPDDRENLRAILEEQGSVSGYNLTFKRKDGEMVWIEDSAHYVYDAAGKPIAVEGLVRDITERKHAERALLVAREAAETANRAKGEFLANMSHEIRTPMNAIIGMAHLALKTDLTPRQSGYLRKIDGAATTLLGIINDILDFSKIEAGKLVMERISFDLQEIVDSMADMFAYRAQEKEVEFLLSIDAAVPTALVGDPLRVGQVLTNLVSNAMKFTETGEILIRVQNESITEDSVVLRFIVQDTGIGLTEEQRGRLFQSFTQADSSTTRKYGGTGLGLTICKRLVELMDGDIEVESEAGVGSTFSFTAQFQQQSDPEVTLPPVEARSLEGLKILVVDDNATSREILQQMLESLSFDVRQVASGAEALAELKMATEPFDLVLMDWKMPGLDGIEASRLIKNSDALARTPNILMVSAYGREEIMQQTEDAGLAGFLVKPVSSSTLLESITHAMGKGAGTRIRTSKHDESELKRHQEQLRGAHILVVEDNEINQEVAAEVLSSAGIIVSLADNGQKGVEALQCHTFDCVLMDIQMPVMDGYEATGLIRNELGLLKLPIIAMTANALSGDREKCLAAGMDDHVAKPIDVANLFSTLAKWVNIEVKPPNSGTAVPPSENQTSGDAPAKLNLQGIDVENGLARIGNNHALYRRLIARFYDGQSNVTNEINEAIEKGDRETAIRLAHSLKGVAGNIGAATVAKAAWEVEKVLTQSEAGLLAPALAHLTRALEPLLSSIAALPKLDEQPVVNTEVPVAEVAGAGVRPLLSELKQLLDGGDTEAVQVLEQLQAQLEGTAYASDVSAAAGFAAQYNFQQALQHILEVEKMVDAQTTP